MDVDATSAERRLAELGIELPPPLPPFGDYVPAVRSGSQLWVGGHFGTRPDGSILTGKVGRDLTAEDALEAARSAAVNLLATVRAELGSLDQVDRVVRVYGVVNSAPDFIGQTAVIDAASAVLVSVFGERGRHARLAVGVAALPGDLVLEVEAVLDVRAAEPTGGADRGER
ncbi:MAG: RidA family protein [Microthrixaceae bacterium]